MRQERTKSSIILFPIAAVLFGGLAFVANVGNWGVLVSVMLIAPLSVVIFLAVTTFISKKK